MGPVGPAEKAPSSQQADLPQGEQETKGNGTSRVTFAPGPSGMKGVGGSGSCAQTPREAPSAAPRALTAMSPCPMPDGSLPKHRVNSLSFVFPNLVTSYQI